MEQFFAAIEGGDLPSARAVLDGARGALAPALPNALCIAARYGHVTIVRWLVETVGVDPTRGNVLTGETPAGLAARENRPETLRALLTSARGALGPHDVAVALVASALGNAPQSARVAAEAAARIEAAETYVAGELGAAIALVCAAALGADRSSAPSSILLYPGFRERIRMLQ